MGYGKKSFFRAKLTSPPKIVFMDAAPTSSDIEDFDLADQWLDKSSATMYTLVDMTAGSATWAPSGSTESITSIVTDSGTATPSSNSVTFDGNSTQGVSSSASGSTVSFTVASATTSQIGVTELATDTEAKAVSSSTVVVTPSNLAAVFGAPPALGSVTPAAVTTSALVATTADINGGTIDATTIGGATPAAVTTSALVATTADINGGTIDATTIGATTKAALSATTGVFSSTVDAVDEFTIFPSFGSTDENIFMKASGDTRYGISVGSPASGTESTADPYYNLNAGGGATNYYFGIDNSDADSFTASTGVPGTNNFVHVNTSGQINLPLQPAFLARCSTASTVVSANTITTVAFDTEVFDQAGNFSANTFTAPVTGRYQLSTVVVCGDLGATSANLYITINTSNRTYSFGQMANTGVMYIPGSVLVDMDSADTATVSIRCGEEMTYLSEGQNSLGGTYFSGYLAC